MNDKCCHCQLPLNGVRFPYELRRYRPNKPRRLCPRCRNGLFELSDLIEKLMIKEEKESEVGPSGLEPETNRL